MTTRFVIRTFLLSSCVFSEAGVSKVLTKITRLPLTVAKNKTSSQKYFKTRTKEKSATYDFYSNQRDLISTNLTFLFIGHWEQTINFHWLKKIRRVAALLPSVIRSSYCFEMVARIIMWLYKTSNIAQVRPSYKFFLDEKPDNSKIFAAVLLVGKRSSNHDHSALNPCSL